MRSSYRTDPDFELLLNAAVAAGKFSESRKDHYRALHSRDSEGTRAAIGLLHAAGDVAAALQAPGAAGSLPLGASGAAEGEYPAEWLPELHRPARGAARAGRATRQASPLAAFPPAAEVEHVRPVRQPEVTAAAPADQEGVRAWIRRVLPETRAKARREKQRVVRSDP